MPIPAGRGGAVNDAGILTAVVLPRRHRLAGACGCRAQLLPRYRPFGPERRGRAVRQALRHRRTDPAGVYAARARIQQDFAIAEEVRVLVGPLPYGTWRRLPPAYSRSNRHASNSGNGLAPCAGPGALDPSKEEGGYSNRVQQPWYIQVEAGGRIGTSDLLK
jgi:hypothetical protein